MTEAAPHRSRRLVTREESHRRALLLGIGALLLLSVSPVFGHYFATGMERALEGRDHLGALCLIALHHLLRPVHVLFHILVVVGVAYASYDRIRAMRRVRRALDPLEASVPHPGDPFWRAAAAVGINP